GNSDEQQRQLDPPTQIQRHEQRDRRDHQQAERARGRRHAADRVSRVHSIRELHETLEDGERDLEEENRDQYGQLRSDLPIREREQSGKKKERHVLHVTAQSRDDHARRDRLSGEPDREREEKQRE